MAKSPPSTQHSDIDGVHEDERANTDTAAGEGAGSLDRAAKENVARPEHATDEENKDDRSAS